MMRGNLVTVRAAGEQYISAVAHQVTDHTGRGLATAVWARAWRYSVPPDAGIIVPAVSAGVLGCGSAR